MALSDVTHDQLEARWHVIIETLVVWAWDWLTGRRAVNGQVVASACETARTRLPFTLHGGYNGLIQQ